MYHVGSSTTADKWMLSYTSKPHTRKTKLIAIQSVRGRKWWRRRWERWRRQITKKKWLEDWRWDWNRAKIVYQKSPVFFNFKSLEFCLIQNRNEIVGEKILHYATMKPWNRGHRELITMKPWNRGHRDFITMKPWNRGHRDFNTMKPWNRGHRFHYYESLKQRS